MEEDNQIEVKFGGPCCFCGEIIEETETDPCNLTVETSKGYWQVWYCHGECFKKRIEVNHYIYLSPAHF